MTHPKRRTVHVTVLLTVDEHARFTAVAKADHRSLGDFFRVAAEERVAKDGTK